MAAEVWSRVGALGVPLQKAQQVLEPSLSPARVARLREKARSQPVSVGLDGVGGGADSVPVPHGGITPSPSLPSPAPVCAVCAEGSSAAALHPQEPLPVPDLVRGHLLLLRVPHVFPDPAEHHLPGHAGEGHMPTTGAGGVSAAADGLSPATSKRGGLSCMAKLMVCV